MQWVSVWTNTREACGSKAQFSGAMQELRSRHMARLAEGLKRRDGVAGTSDLTGESSMECPVLQLVPVLVVVQGAVLDWLYVV